MDRMNKQSLEEVRKQLVSQIDKLEEQLETVDQALAEKENAA